MGAREKPGAHTPSITGLKPTSTASSRSTSPPSAARPGPTPRPTPGSSTTSARSSPRPRNPRSAATSPGGSASTSAKNGGGRCEACQGQGLKKIEMHFLPDVYVECEVCRGKRYNRETLEVKYRGKNIADVLDMTVENALAFFENHPKILRFVRVPARRRARLPQLGQPSTSSRAARPSASSSPPSWQASSARGTAWPNSQRRRASRHTPRRRGHARTAKSPLATTCDPRRAARASGVSQRPHALHPRRAHHRPALRGHPQALSRSSIASQTPATPSSSSSTTSTSSSAPTGSSTWAPKAATAAARDIIPSGYLSPSGTPEHEHGGAKRRAQRGVFVFDKRAEDDYMNTGIWPCMANAAMLESTTHRPIVRKITLNWKHVRGLYGLLLLEGVNRARLMPTLDNVALVSRAQLDAHPVSLLLPPGLDLFE
jgi:hypothetical protein